jgi:hypothetical protein
MKKVQIMWNNLKVKLSLFLTPEPEIKDDYIDKVVYLLRRDFDTEVQNDVLFAIGKKLSVLREQDMRKMEDDYIRLQKSSTNLNSRIVFQ